jgi:hypothetical protein
LAQLGFSAEQLIRATRTSFFTFATVNFLPASFCPGHCMPNASAVTFSEMGEGGRVQAWCQ